MVRNKLFIAKEWHIQPSEIDRMFFYEFELVKQEINVAIREQEKQNKEQEKQYSDIHRSMNPSSMMNSMRSMNMPGMKMPAMPTMSMPRFK